MTLCSLSAFLAGAISGSAPSAAKHLVQSGEMLFWRKDREEEIPWVPDWACTQLWVAAARHLARVVFPVNCESEEEFSARPTPSINLPQEIQSQERKICAVFGCY